MPKWTPEQAREMAAKGGKAKAETRRPPEERAKEAAKRFTPKAMELLQKAAEGKEEFSGLKPGERLDAVLALLAYGIGKPATQKPEPKPEPDNTAGLQVM